MATWLTQANSQQHSARHRSPDSQHYDDHSSQYNAHSLSNHNPDFRRDMFNGLLKAPSRSHTPLSFKIKSNTSHGFAAHPPGSASQSQSGHAPVEHDAPGEEDVQVIKFRALYEESEAKIASIFDKVGQLVPGRKRKRDEEQDNTIPKIVAPDSQPQSQSQSQSQPHPQPPSVPTSRKRKLDDDDYDEYDDDDDDDDDAGDGEEDEEADTAASPLKGKSSKIQKVADRTTSPMPRPLPSTRPSSETSKGGGGEIAKGKDKPEDARKALEEAKRREEQTVRNMSRTLFFTLENDADAMLDQQRLEEAERRAEAEAEGHAKGQNTVPQQGSLSNANLGASSLTLKNLIARIDQYRSNVQATESELKALMSEVRKNRSKWANEEKVGQEELYEAAEKVLNELKAQTEHSTPFLQAVKKKDAPDYSKIVTHPMDFGTMTKKLKQLAYKSKQEFVDDLHLIWANCLKYNSAPEHPMRKHALHMRKETDKLVPLIPDIVIKDRAEFEAEERRQRIDNGELDDNAEDSDDEPIMASRGRKAPSKKTSKAPNAARKTGAVEGTPAPESKPSQMQPNSLPNGIARAESEVEVSSQGHATPPPGTLTPTALERVGTASVIDTQSELPDSEIPSLPFPHVPAEVEEEDVRLWKQRTKRERAQVAAARHRLFRGDKLNTDEEALLRSRSSMRKWQRLQPGSTEPVSLYDLEAEKPQNQSTLAEGFENDEESMLPDYYDSQAALPDLNPKLRWEQDTQGYLIDQQEDYLHLFPSSQWVAPNGRVSSRLADNMKQIQETRKIVSKIGVVKQMQLQSQLYQNQFTKFEPAPFLEADIENHVMNDDGPLMAPWVARAALTRSVGEIFFHAGFEEFQPSALEALTDITTEFFTNLCSNLSSYLSEDKIPLTTSLSSAVSDVSQRLPFFDRTPAEKPAFTLERAVLHTFHTSGLDLRSIHEHATDDLDRASTRLSTMYTRMRSHYADLLKPAVSDETAQGSGSFETGEQFVGGDFADDLGEDFFGFRELGLDRELGLVNFSVPLHLLRNRLATNAAANNPQAGDQAEKLFVPPPPYPRVNIESIESEIGLVQEYFRRRLQENGDRPLPEDMDLPVKQRKGYGRARVPATGKIGDGKVGVQASPTKKPPPKPNGTSTSKNNLSNGVSKARTKSITNGLERQDSTMGGDGTDNDATMNDIDAASPTPQANGGDLFGGDDDEDVPLKTKAKTPQKIKLDRKKSTGNVKEEDVLNGDTLMNGVDSPAQENASGKARGKGKSKGKDGDEDGMMSPESL